MCECVVFLCSHSAAVWQVAWSHPKFGTLLASVSYDRKLIIWKEDDSGTANSTVHKPWVKVYEATLSDASLNSVAWAPHQFGLMLAVGAADSNVTVLTYVQQTNEWKAERFFAHGGGVNSVSWGPGIASTAILPPNAAKGIQPVPRFVTGGCDNVIRIWRQNEQGKWSDEKCFVGTENVHKDWVRDVAWAPAVGIPVSTIATCSEDGSVCIYTEDLNGHWKKSTTLPIENVKVWRLSWSVMGNILAVSQGDNKVSLWKENLDGTWKNLSAFSEADMDAQKPLH